MLLKDSKTKINLMRAFAGESQARNRYNLSALQAKKENLIVIQKAFDYTACQEQAHATIFYNHLKELTDSNIDMDGGYPVNVYNSTLSYLKAAHHNEYEEYETVYKNFGDIAKEEGFGAVANSFYMIAEIEKTHGDRFLKYYTELEQNTLFNKDIEVQWICTNCGHIHTGKSAPQVCPVCNHVQGYFDCLAI